MFGLEQQGHHKAMMLSQLWVLNHLAPGGDLSVIQRHPQWDSVVSLQLLKRTVLLGCFHTTTGSDSLSCVHFGKRTVWFEWTVTREIKSSAQKRNGTIPQSMGCGFSILKNRSKEMFNMLR